MTNTEMLKFINSAIDNNGTVSLIDALKMREQLHVDIATEEAKKVGKRNAYAAAMRLIKRARKNDDRPALRYAHTLDGAQWYCDGFVLIKFTERLGLPEMTAPEFNDIQIENGRDMLNGVSKSLDDARGNLELSIPAPSVAQVKTYIKTASDELKRGCDKGVRYIFDTPNGETVSDCEANTLADVIEAIDADTIKLSRNVSHPIYIHGNGGEAIICPLAQT